MLAVTEPPLLLLISCSDDLTETFEESKMDAQASFNPRGAKSHFGNRAPVRLWPALLYCTDHARCADFVLFFCL